MPVPKLDMPPLPLAGGCQCGAVRYRIRAVPMVFYLCHCRECQRHTTSAFGESLRIGRADLEIEGELGLVTRIAVSGNRREGRFCPRCGTRIVHGTQGARQVNIKAGTLDETGWLAPAGHIWTDSKQRFVVVGEAELAFPREPGAAGMAAMADRWRAMIAKS